MSACVEAVPGDATASAVAAEATETEALRRAITRSQFVRRCAQSLLLDTATTATAIVLVQQFYSSRSDSPLDHRVIGGACLFLATKSCEVTRTLRSIVNVVHAVMNETIEPLAADAPYTNLKSSLINAEQTVLRELKFDIDIVLPHAFLFNYARHLDLSESTAHCALAIVNDLIAVSDSLRFPPTALAAASLLLASKVTHKDIGGSDAKWWYRYDTCDEDIQAITQLLGRIQDATKPNSS